MKLLLLATVFSLGLLTSGCASTTNRVPASIHHAVFFVLNNPTEAPELAADCAQLGSIPGVIAWAAGTPVPSDRPSVDAAYHVGLYVRFRSAADYQTYISHPIHTQLVDKWRPRWKSILIRDFGHP